MPIPLATPVIIVTAVIAAGVLGIAAVQFSPDKKTSKSNPLLEPVNPTATPSISPLVSSPSITPPSAVLDAPPPRPNAAEKSTAPSSLVPVTQESKTATTATSQDEPSISFINLPTSVRSGQSFTIAWQVTSPGTIKGTNTTLKVERHSDQQNGSARSNSNSTSSQSFGSFTTPAQFDAQFTFSGDPGDIEVEVSATIDGKTMTETTTINFEA